MNLKDKNISNIHNGHRQRLRSNIDKHGLYNMDDVHFLEYLLTFVISRADTNPIAHELLETFGSIDEVFNADIEALLDVKGVGIKTARFLQYMSVVAFMYNKSRTLKKPKLDTLKNMVNFIKNVLPPSENEQLILIVLNKNLTLKNYKIYKGVSHSFISLDVNEITDFLIKHKAKFLIIAHTHPKHNPQPSLEDLQVFKNFQVILNALSISTIDNLILGEDSFYSNKRQTIYSYDNNDANTNVINSNNY